MQYAGVIVDISLAKLDKCFSYIIPEEMQKDALPGAAVLVPFGSRTLDGYILWVSDTVDFDPAKLKPILKVKQQGMDSNGQLLALAEWMRKHYGATLNQALKTVLPSAKRQTPKMRKVVHAACSTQVLSDELAVLMARTRHSLGKERLLKALLTQPDIPWDELTHRLSVPTADIRDLEKKGLLAIEEVRSLRNPLGAVSAEKNHWQLPQLNHLQQQIRDDFVERYDRGDRTPCLLHGVTGSGKTEVYMEMIDHVLKKNRQVIVLIPEIALTYQTVMRFYLRFGGKVSILNSRMSAGERYDQFLRAKEGEVTVMVGPRSALFTPFPDLGLIIVDEEHDSAYKSQQPPKYHARETAIQRAKLSDATVVLGSATPSVASFYRAKKGEYHLYSMQQRAGGGQLPSIHVTDLRAELKAGNRSMIGRELMLALKDRLDKNEQSMLFLNRRGMAGFVSCRACGFVIKCPHCDVSMSLHKDGRLHCHYCGYKSEYKKVCPSCGSKLIGTMKAGTERVQQVIEQLFPKARVLRMDADTTRSKNGHEKLLQAFANHEADILIGTQMIVKGHDFPGVTLMGILAADLSLNISDYRSGERTFDLLLQACGRAGRGDKPSDAYIQTYQPDHYVIQSVKDSDYFAFYEQEIAYRKLMNYPPFGHLLQIEITSLKEERAQETGEYLRQAIQKEDASLAVFGPQPAAIAKISDTYRMVLLIRDTSYERLVKAKDMADRAFREAGAPKGADIWFDFDPMDGF
ncbi:replication restart DNA helicase PriA [Lachnospiraceae bacterium C10]|nr:replication restart DNA helicase PriA [Lachnospiraceae bacterium C10]